MIESRLEDGGIGGAIHHPAVFFTQKGAVSGQRTAAKPSMYGPETWAEFGGFEPFVDEFVVGRFLGFEPRQVLEMARAGEIPAHPFGHTRKRWRFRLSEVEEHFSGIHNRAGAKMRTAVPATKERNRLG